MGSTPSLCSKVSVLPAVEQSLLGGRKGLAYSIPRVRKGAGDYNGIYFFVRELGGSQAFQASLSDSLISQAVHNDQRCLVPLESAAGAGQWTPMWETKAKEK